MKLFFRALLSLGRAGLAFLAVVAAVGSLIVVTVNYPIQVGSFVGGILLIFAVFLRMERLQKQDELDKYLAERRKVSETEGNEK